MKVRIHKNIHSHEGLLVAPIFVEQATKLPNLFPEEIKNFLGKIIANKEFKAKNGEQISTYLNQKNLPEKLLAIGFGRVKNYNVRTAKELGGKIGKYAKFAKAKEVTLLMTHEMESMAEELVEGLLMSQYETDKLKSKRKDVYVLENLNIVVNKPSKTLESKIDRAQTMNSAITLVKDLVNAPSNVVDSEYMVAEARRIARKNDYKIVILGEPQLKKMGWGGLLAVNQGSAKEPKCIALQYDGAKNRKEPPVVIVGKGVIFDSGGYNLKPSGYLENMHQDMAGGATVLGIFELLKKLGIKKNVVGIIPLAENLIGGKSYRPSDVIKTFSGLTVEITNTDAEGRLIMADAITYGAQFKPKYIITLATLTGSAMSALGDRFAALVGNDVSLKNKIQSAGREVDELGWPMPLHRDYIKKMESRVADLRNIDTGSERFAGCSKAAAFLSKFMEKNKWCHMDIAGTAFVEDAKEYQTKGATAHGLQMLIRFLEKY